MNSRLHTLAASVALCCLGTLTTTSCSSDDDDYYTPENVILLNMMNEANGKTMLGESGVYINNADNFTSGTGISSITDLGQRGGYGASPDLALLVKEVAVTPGNFYQVFDHSDIRMFASGKRALSVNASYYNLYAGEWIFDSEGSHAGVKVSYNIMQPDNNIGLPTWDYSIGTLTHHEMSNSSWVSPESVSYTFPQNSEINVDYNYWEDYLSIDIEGSTVTASINNMRPRHSGKAYVYARSGNLFTRTVINIEYVTK